MPDWGELANKLDWYLRLKSFVVGLKLLEDEADLDKNPWLRRPEKKATLCQLITMVRTHDWTVGATAEDLVRPSCGSIVGLNPVPDYVADGRMRSKVWLASQEDAVACEAAIPRVPFGRYQAVVLGPLRYNPFDPDLVLIYPNPAQASLLINAIQYDKWERLSFFSVGETSCSDVVGQGLLSGKPALSIPCFGERRYGPAQDDELAVSLPPGDLERIVANLGELYKKGIRYPIAQFGTTCDPEGFLNQVYDFDGMESKRND